MNFIPQLIGTGIGFFKGGGLAALGSGIVKDIAKDPMGTLSFGASALSAFSKYSAGLADQREAEANAARETLGATQELLRGRQGENEILDRLIDTVAQQRVAFAAAGNDPFIGTPAAVTRDSVERGERAGRVTSSNAVSAWFTRRQTAKAYRDRGKAYGLGGLVEAGATVLDGVASVMRRG